MARVEHEVASVRAGALEGSRCGLSNRERFRHRPWVRICNSLETPESNGPPRLRKGIVYAEIVHPAEGFKIAPSS